MFYSLKREITNQFYNSFNKQLSKIKKVLSGLPDPNPSLILKFRIQLDPNLNIIFDLGFGLIQIRVLKGRIRVRIRIWQITTFLLTTQAYTKLSIAVKLQYISKVQFEIINRAKKSSIVKYFLSLNYNSSQKRCFFCCVNYSSHF